jgi:hypothetical protein
MGKGMKKPVPEYRGKRGPYTSAVLARLLDAEGFSDHVANQVEGYWRRSSAQKDLAHIEYLKRGIAALAQKLTDDEKMIMGKFVSLHMRMGFDTGLRMGLAVRLIREPDTARQHFDPAADHKLDEFTDPAP